MAETEPERLWLQIHELLERRAKLRAVFEQALDRVLTEGERQDIAKVLGLIDQETAELQRRLDALRGGQGS